MATLTRTFDVISSYTVQIADVDALQKVETHPNHQIFFTNMHFHHPLLPKSSETKDIFFSSWFLSMQCMCNHLPVTFKQQHIAIMLLTYVCVRLWHLWKMQDRNSQQKEKKNHRDGISQFLQNDARPFSPDWVTWIERIVIKWNCKMKPDSSALVFCCAWHTSLFWCGYNLGIKRQFMTFSFFCFLAYWSLYNYSTWSVRSMSCTQ